MKKFIVGIILGTMIGCTIPIFASGGRTIEVFDNVKKIIIDSIEKPLDANSKPFLHNGVTYVPLRFISENLNIPVEWEGETGTIFLGEKQGSIIHYWGKDINHMAHDMFVSLEYEHNGVMKSDNVGNRYTNYLQFSSTLGNGYVDFPLMGEYTSFEAVLAVPKGNESKLKGNFIIELDGKEVYNKNFAPTNLPENIKINVSNAKKISFKIDGRSTIVTPVGLFNGKFIK